jgi:hypothetical protein
MNVKDVPAQTFARASEANLSCRSEEASRLILRLCRPSMTQRK